MLTESVSPEKHGDLFAVLNRMDSTHPQYPHWYLPWFGVETVQLRLPARIEHAHL